MKNRVFAVLAIESSVAWELQFWSQALEFRVNMRNFCSQALGCRVNMFAPLLLFAAVFVAICIIPALFAVLQSSFCRYLLHSRLVRSAAKAKMEDGHGD